MFWYDIRKKTSSLDFLDNAASQEGNIISKKGVKP